MRIRTRYKLFKIIIALAVVTFLVSLWDIFGNAADWFIYVMIAYIVLAVCALLLYIGFKPELLAEEGPAPVPEPIPAPMEPDVVHEIDGPRRLLVEGVHDFRCPFCSNTFALELTHLNKMHELRMDCPFCANTIRIPRRPKVTPGPLIDLDRVTADEQVLFSCQNCGEALRYTAPGQRPEMKARVHTCPHCGSAQVVPAAGAAV